MFLEPIDWIMECATHRGYAVLILARRMFLQIWTLQMTWLSCLTCLNVLSRDLFGGKTSPQTSKFPLKNF